jgi:hypothetical protein
MFKNGIQEDHLNFRGKKEQEAGSNFALRTLIGCSPHEILSVQRV